MKEKIRLYLTTEELAREIKEYEVLESTQILAKTMAYQVPNGTMLIANHQTKGIGTHERTWYSSKGENITFTLVVYPKCDIEKLEGLTIKLAEGVQEVLKKEYAITTQIKAPNDILLHGKKLAGIITQSTTIEKTVQYLLIGIGLNVNQIEFPKEIEKTATSLKKEFSIEFEREKLIAEICNIWEKYLISF